MTDNLTSEELAGLSAAVRGEYGPEKLPSRTLCDDLAQRMHELMASIYAHEAHWLTAPDVAWERMLKDHVAAGRWDSVAFVAMLLWGRKV
jgi:hypothetical protein